MLAKLEHLDDRYLSKIFLNGKTAREVEMSEVPLPPTPPPPPPPLLRARAHPAMAASLEVLHQPASWPPGSQLADTYLRISAKDARPFRLSQNRHETCCTEV